LNTRPREQAAELTRLLRSRAFEVVEAPAIAIASAWTAAELQATRGDLGRGAYAWVVLASQNAARGLEDALAGSQLLCGSATADALGLAAAISLERFSATAAVEVLRPRVTTGQRVLVPRAAEGRDELIDGLRALGLIVDAPVAYRTVSVDSAAARLGEGGVDVVALCSPSAASSVATALPADVAVVCLGETTAAAARSIGVRVDGVAAATSMPGLVDAIESLVGSGV
jgi:uroporphyrinogen III methyltransferase/synthase